jgi:nucleoside-diphosphate-sugar epimerase
MAASVQMLQFSNSILYSLRMRVLIVGCGYVGLPLGKELVRQGHEVFGLRRSALAEVELRAAGIRPLHADITQPETLTGLPRDFDWVVNCTASGGGGPEDYRRIYLDGNRNLVAWLAGSPLRKFVYTSSSSVYGQNDGSTVTEESPAEPEAPTAKVLVEAEQFLLAAAGGPQARPPHRRKFPAVILRVAGIYGPGRGHWFKAFLRGDARLEGDGRRILNMIHRDDLIGVIIAALERGAPGEIYNAADNEPVSQREFFQWLADALQRPLPPMVAAEAESLRRRGVTHKRVSNAKLRQALDYVLRYPDFRAGYGAELRRMAEELADE